MSKVKDFSLAGQGRILLDWAKDNMPVLASLRNRFEKEKPLAGLKIGVALHFEKKTGVLMETLASGGAEVTISSCNPLTTDDSVAAALGKSMNVFAWAGQTKQEYYECLETVIASKPDITIDDGCDLIHLLHTKFRDDLDRVIGSCEETTTGVIRLKAMEKEGILAVPVMAVNNAYSKHLYDNRYGTGQSVIEGILNATNILIAGKTAVVVGYGWCGRGIADRLKGLGARVIVVETAGSLVEGPSGYHRALEALYDGFSVMAMGDAASEGDLFITATGNKHVISVDHMQVMKDGAILANSGHFDHEIDVDGLEKISQKQNRGLHVDQFKLESGKRVVVLAEGRLVNLAQPTGQGHPIEIMDGSFGIQALCVEYLAKNGKGMKACVFDVPKYIDDTVAKIALEAQGINLDPPTEEQKKYSQSWKEGT